MRILEPLVFLDGCLRLGQLDHAIVAGRDRFGHRVARNLRNVLDGPCAVAPECLLDGAALAAHHAPHCRIVGAFREIPAQPDFLVLVPLAQNAAVRLLHVGRIPGRRQEVQFRQALLHVDAGSHVRRRADEDALATLAHVLEHGFLLLVGLVVAHESDFRRRNARVLQALHHPFARRESPVLLDGIAEADRRKHDLRASVDAVWLPVRGIDVAVRRLVLGDDVVDHQVQLGTGIVLQRLVGEARVDRRQSAIGANGNDRVRVERLVLRWLPGFRRLQARKQVLAHVLFERFALLRRDHFRAATLDRRPRHEVPELLHRQHIHELADAHHQFRDIHEFTESLDLLEFCGSVALPLEGNGTVVVRPGVEGDQAVFFESGVIEIPLNRVKLGDRVGDRRSRSQHRRASGVLRFKEAHLGEQAERALRSVGVDPFDLPVGGEI